MWERLIIAIVLLTAGFVLYRLYHRQHIHRANALAVSDPLLQTESAPLPTILYFTTPMCAACKAAQTPALQSVQTTLGEESLRIIQIDATAQPDAANRWGVLTAPTTFVIDANGKTVAVNRGTADAATLLKQLHSAAKAI